MKLFKTISIETEEEKNHVSLLTQAKGKGQAHQKQLPDEQDQQ